MKKIALVLVFLFTFSPVTTSYGAGQNQLNNEDCFDVAIRHLLDHEHVLGFTLNQKDARDFLNDQYMLCWCLRHIDYCFDHW